MDIHPTHRMGSEVVCVTCLASERSNLKAECPPPPLLSNVFFCFQNPAEDKQIQILFENFGLVHDKIEQGSMERFTFMVNKLLLQQATVELKLKNAIWRAEVRDATPTDSLILDRIAGHINDEVRDDIFWAYEQIVSEVQKVRPIKEEFRA